MKPRKQDCEGYGRRDFLHVGAASMMGLGLSQLLQAQASASKTSHEKNTAKNVIMVWLSGGPSTIDMWDMKPKAPANIRGEFSAINTSADGIQICEHLPKLAKVMHHCCVVRSIHHTLAAHGPGTELLMTGNRPTPALEYPSLGSVVSHEKQVAEGVPTFMTMGEGAESGAGYLGAAYNPFRAFVAGGRSAVQPGTTTVGLPDGFSVDDLARRGRLLRAFDQQLANVDRSPVAQQLNMFQQQAIDILRSNKTRNALNVAKEDKKIREKYGFRPLSTRLLAARRLVEAGVQFVSVGMAGWDTHGNNFGSLRTQLLPELDQALATLIEDLEQRGLLDSTLVYCTGEFGRTPAVNGAAGRDHWARAMACLLAGGPIHPGSTFGETDANGFEPTTNPCSPMDVSATVLNSIGIHPDTLLQTPSGRPIAAIGGGGQALPIAKRLT